MLWQGGDSFIGDYFSIESKYCSSFQPDVTILDEKAHQKLNKSLMFEFGVQLQFSSDSPSVTQVAHAKTIRFRSPESTLLLQQKCKTFEYENTCR